MYINTYVLWMAIETKFSKFCIFFSLDEYLYTKLSKWALWLIFVMSKIKQSIVLNSHICKVVIYNYILCWLYSMKKSVVIALILFLIFCGILLY